MKETVKISLLQFNQTGTWCLKSRVSHLKFRFPLNATKETGIQVWGFLHKVWGPWPEVYDIYSSYSLSHSEFSAILFYTRLQTWWISAFCVYGKVGWVYFLCIYGSTSSSRILFRRSLFLYAHLSFLSPNVYISLQIFIRILFLELILFFRIASLALIWSFAHFMYIRVIYIFYLQLNQLGKTLELLEGYHTSQIIGFANVLRLYVVSNRDILHTQDWTNTFFFHAVNLKLNRIFFLLFAFLYTSTSGDTPCIVPRNCFIKFIMTNCKMFHYTLIFTDLFKQIKYACSLHF